MKKNSSLPNIKLHYEGSNTPYSTNYNLQTTFFTDKLSYYRNLSNEKTSNINTSNGTPVLSENTSFPKKKLFSSENLFYLQNPKLTYKIFGKNYYNVYEEIKTKKSTPSSNKNIFKKTKNFSPDAMKEFYTKYQKFKIHNRKNPMEINTPSLAFIKSSEKEKVIPNPIGLISRSHLNKCKLNLSNQKVGDNYMKALSSSLHYSSNINELLLSSNRLTQYGVSALFSSIVSNPQLQSKLLKINISKNSIGDMGTKNLITFLCHEDCNVEELNIESCELSDININEICNAIKGNINVKLVYFNIGNNGLSDAVVKNLKEMIEKNHTLQNLILSHNCFHNRSGAIIINTIKSLYYLKMFDISWNNIGDNLIKEPLFEEMCQGDTDPKRKYRNFELNETKHTMIYNFRKNPYDPNNTESNQKNKGKAPKSKSVDQKNNPKIIKTKIKIKIPQREVSLFAKELGEYFQNKSLSLIHLDISHNNIPYQDCEFLANTVKDNHTILGVHLDGNEMRINSLGFIYPMKEELKEESYYSKCHLFYNIEDNKAVYKSKIDNVRKIRNQNNCWICEGWREIEFTYIPKDEKILKEAEFTIVKIHFDFDNWNHYDMICNGRLFSTVRMCPPGTIYYFITVDTIPVEAYKEDTTWLDKKNEIHYVFDDEYFDELHNLKQRQYYTNTQNDSEASNDENLNLLSKYDKNINVHILGKKVIEKNENVIDDTFRPKLKFCEPRPIRQFNRFVKPRTPWTFPVSIWAKYDYSYEGDSDDYLHQCFEHDFKRCQFEKDFKDEESLDILKKELWKHYRNIVDCYKNLSSFSGFSVWQISQNVLTDWINKCPNLCDKKYDINNVYLVQTGICANNLDKEERVKNNNKNLSDNLVRHQFLALLVKVPKDKYIRSKLFFN